MKQRIWVAGLLLILLLVTGCVRTDEFNERTAKNLPQEVQQVQTAIDEYVKGTPVLPLKSAQGPSLYQKYLIDFDKLKGYLADSPSNSFEKGGRYVFVIADPGKRPKVRVMDLRVTDKIRDLQVKVNAYKDREKKLPFGKKEGGGFYSLDFKSLDADPLLIPSPYHSQIKLPIILDKKGQLFIDYRSEVMQALENEKKKPSIHKDLRELLWKDSLFVPAYSPKMINKGKDPVFQPE
ncbi:hypothetical protein SAMN05444487_104192 [Marininema mesophilum]|uniref:Lipoprotein n=1 Tax=Marininema mesophilum TaxID=1048340 RepID=A0A1H2URB6_9BACL|nr:hypothetical protein [Marininema mesophilum]SDW58641.1 hypothetical protein SAMN05444487_104192 [Marininema mesophilum]